MENILFPFSFFFFLSSTGRSRAASDHKSRANGKCKITNYKLLESEKRGFEQIEIFTLVAKYKPGFFSLKKLVSVRIYTDKQDKAWKNIAHGNKQDP